MESHDIAILVVVLILIGVVAYIVYTNYSQPPQTSGRQTQTGEIEAPTPFNPLGKAGDFEIITNPSPEEICGNFKPFVAF